MNIHSLLSHHGVSRNPFSEEDAQTDQVFKTHCIDNTYHVGWDKIFGDPADPSTSIVFGEKGAGKTAIRLQIARHVSDYNARHPEHQLFLIEYDDFNPFLDRFRARMGRRHRRADRMLATWRLWDHMDAILCEGVTKLTSAILADSNHPDAIARDRIRKLTQHQRRDLLLLDACYDDTSTEPFADRWNRLRKQLGFGVLNSYLPWVVGWTVTLGVAALFAYVHWFADSPAVEGEAARRLMADLPWWGYLLVIVAGWLPLWLKFVKRFATAAGIARRLRVGSRSQSALRKALMNFSTSDLSGQPLPNRDRTDDRYALLGKFQNVLSTLGFSGILVLVDRVDEPHLINGSAELMRALLWPLLDNKFLRHPGMGIKMMLPVELSRFIEREDQEFYQRARLDKQNMIPSLQWTGEALFDLANSRLDACKQEQASPSLPNFFDDSVTKQRLLEGFRSLRVPRHLFKFLYRLLVAHCNAHTDQEPSWKISNHMFESVLAVYQRELEAVDRGTGT